MDWTESGSSYFTVSIPGARVLLLNGEIDEDLTGKVIGGLYSMSADSQEEIRLVISSEGGLLLSAMAIANVIHDVQTRGCPVVAQVMGHAMSAATWPLLACSRREAAPSSLLMIHGMTDGLRGDIRHQEVNVAINNELMQDYARRLSGATGKPVDEWMPLLKDSKPQYYWASEALEVGLINGIISF